MTGIDQAERLVETLAGTLWLSLAARPRVASCAEPRSRRSWRKGDGCARAKTRVRLIYFDFHPDLDVPASQPTGAVDWMGVPHMRGTPGAAPELLAAGVRVPLLGS